MKQEFGIEFIAHNPTVKSYRKNEHHRCIDAGHDHVFEVKSPKPITFFVGFDQKFGQIFLGVWNGQFYCKSFILVDIEKSVHWSYLHHKSLSIA